MATRNKALEITPAAVRGFLRQSAEMPEWTAEDAAKALGIKPGDAKAVLAEMQMAGYIETAGRTKYRNTAEGNAVAQVSKAKPIKAETAAAAVSDLLARIKTVNLEKEYLYAVEHAVLFGPYFEGVTPIKDVDIAVELAPKEQNESKLETLVKQQAEEAETAGKKFKSFSDRRAWGRNKVLAFLKGKSRSLALYELNDEILARPNKILMKRGGSHRHR